MPRGVVPRTAGGQLHVRRSGTMRRAKPHGSRGAVYTYHEGDTKTDGSVRVLPRRARLIEGGGVGGLGLSNIGRTEAARTSLLLSCHSCYS